MPFSLSAACTSQLTSSPTKATISDAETEPLPYQDEEDAQAQDDVIMVPSITADDHLEASKQTNHFTSDESDLTDEEDSSLSDDLGSEDEHHQGEDDAAEALAALTGAGAPPASAADGLEGLVALAAGAAQVEEQEDQDDDESDEEAANPHLDQLREFEEPQSSDITPEPEEMDEDEAQREKVLAAIATMKKRAAMTGGATSLLQPEPMVESLPGSAATSRAGSPLDDEDAPKEEDEEEEEEKEKEDEADGVGADEAAEQVNTAAGTPVPEAADQEEDTSTDEAAVRRQEAMEALTKIEIGFAMLRDRLYVERLEEISKEGEMITQGTHPELKHLTNAIEIRRQRRMKLVEMWFEQQEAQYERVAKAEESAAWSVWRTSCANLRRDMMDDFSRKRRKLDREKRSLDAPRPVRRHQVFETELVRNPDRVHVPHPAELEDRTIPSRKRKAAAKRRAVAQESEAANEFVAYPDLQGLNEPDVWMDMERMGIRSAMFDPYHEHMMMGYDPYEAPHPELYYFAQQQARMVQHSPTLRRKKAR